MRREQQGQVQGGRSSYRPGQSKGFQDERARSVFGMRPLRQSWRTPPATQGPACNPCLAPQTCITGTVKLCAHYIEVLERVVSDITPKCCCLKLNQKCMVVVATRQSRSCHSSSRQEHSSAHRALRTPQGPRRSWTCQQMRGKYARHTHP